jgi:serine/threonine protein phosphatase PrpC
VVKPPADVNHRVYVKNQKFPGLAMSRALGDLVGYYGAGISATPDIKCVSLADLADYDSLAVCSDGVWEFVTDEECAGLLRSVPKGEEMHAAEVICKESWDRWIREENGYIVDDITAVVVSLGKSEL